MQDGKSNRQVESCNLHWRSIKKQGHIHAASSEVSLNGNYGIILTSVLCVHWKVFKELLSRLATDYFVFLLVSVYRLWGRALCPPLMIRTCIPNSPYCSLLCTFSGPLIKYTIFVILAWPIVGWVVWGVLSVTDILRFSGYLISAGRYE